MTTLNDLKVGDEVLYFEYGASKPRGIFPVTAATPTTVSLTFKAALSGREWNCRFLRKTGRAMGSSSDPRAAYVAVATPESIASVEALNKRIRIKRAMKELLPLKWNDAVVQFLDDHQFEELLATIRELAGDGK